MHIIQGPGPWQVFVKRPDNIGLNVMEARNKYLTEQLLYENAMSSLLSATAPASTAASAAGAITTIAGPGLSARRANIVEKERNEEKRRIPTPPTPKPPSPKPPVVETYNLITQGSDNIITQDSDTITYQ